MHQMGGLSDHDAGNRRGRRALPWQLDRNRKTIQLYPGTTENP